MRRSTWQQFAGRVPERSWWQAVLFLLVGSYLVVDGLFILSTREAFLGVLRSPAAVTSFVSARDAFRGVLLAPVAVAYFGVFCLVMAAKLALANHQRRAKAGLHGASNVLAIGLLGYFVLALFFGVIALLF